ncbi:MAG: crossover junction endodeoxyribonuclease RuvC [Candidatus Berkiellales bacterium]
MRRILGIDPGSRITGFGVIEQSHPKDNPICLLGGCVRLTATQMPVRLGKLFAEIQEIVKVFKPTELAIEQVFMHKNPNSALKLGQARGVIMAAVVQANLPIYEYAPRLIKQAVVGFGNASKDQVINMVSILLNLTEKPQSDAADALAIALCHLHTVNGSPLLNAKISRRRRYQKRTSKWKSYDRTP